MKIKKAIALSGPSNSGKTTIILKIVEKLGEKLKIAVVKHDPKDKAEFDKVGKDSQRFFASGCDTIVVSPTRTTMFRSESLGFDEIVSSLGGFDLLIVEGLKTWDLPRLSLFRESFDESYLEVSNAVAFSNEMSKYKNKIPRHIDVFDLNDIESICDWVLKNAKELKG